jgi:hypothetical protein
MARIAMATVLGATTEMKKVIDPIPFDDGKCHSTRSAGERNAVKKVQAKRKPRAANGSSLRRKNVNGKSASVSVTQPQRLMHDLANDLAAAHLRLATLVQAPADQEMVLQMEATMRILGHAQEVLQQLRDH